MPLVFRILLGALLAWQAWSTCSTNWQKTIAGSQVPFARRFCEPTADKLERAAGDNWQLLAEIRESCPADALLVTEMISGDPKDYAPEQLLLLMKRVGVIDQLRFLMFPEPRVLRVFHAPRFVQEWSARDQDAVLLWMPGNESPPTGEGWQRIHQGSGFQLWTFRTG